MNRPTVQKIGKYEIIREIGRSNDVVYEAYDPQLKRRVAIKELIIPPGLSGEKAVERRERFYREARAAGSLQHPNIVTIYEVGEDNGRHYMVMELLEGQNLREILQVKGVLSIEEVVNIVEQVLNALIVAHSRGVIHRDIKPENIHILPGGIVKLTDFGIARITFEPSLTAEGEVFGTPSYMSPEQIRGLPLDGRSDLFSLGVVMYEMLSGRKPFTGDSPVTITYNILSQEPEPIAGIPLPLWDIIKRALHKKPADRFKDAEEMLSALKKFCQLPITQVDRTPLPPLSVSSVPSSQLPAPYGPAPSPPASTSLTTEPTSSLPPRRRIIYLSETQKNIITLFLVTIMSTGALLLFIFGGKALYERWEIAKRRAQAIALFREGIEYLNKGDKGTALQRFQEAFQLDRGDLDRSSVAQATRVAIATIYTNSALEEYRKGNLFQALNLVNQALLWDSVFAPAYLLRGNIYFRLHMMDMALSDWQFVVVNNSMSREAQLAKEGIASVYYARGVEAYQRGDVTGARYWWNQALNIAPGSTAAQQAENALSRLEPSFP